MKNVDINTKYFTFTYSNGKYHISLGNFSDAGWYWSGDKKDLMDFLIRLAKSQVAEEFIEQMKKHKITLSDIKKDVALSIRKYNSGIYPITGDNVLWHFGETDFYIYSEEIEKEYGEDFWDYFTYSYERFIKKGYGKQVKEILMKILRKSKTFTELFYNITSEDTKEDIFEIIQEYFDYEIMLASKKMKKKI